MGDTIGSIDNEEKKNKWGRKVSFFHLMPYMLRARRLRNVLFQVVHCDQPEREIVSQDGSLLSSSITESSESHHRKMRTDNTFIVPENHLEISATNISAIMKTACSTYLHGNPSTSDITQSLPKISERIKAEIKNINLERYRILVTCHAFNGEPFQGKFSSGFCWDTRMDNYVEYTHKMPNGRLICLAYLIHME